MLELFDSLFVPVLRDLLIELVFNERVDSISGFAKKYGWSLMQSIKHKNHLLSLGFISETRKGHKKELILTKKGTELLYHFKLFIISLRMGYEHGE